MNKILYIILDGLGDLPTPELDGKTPLEAASTPNMDSLAKKGACGYVYTVCEGIAPESDVAVISILGYDAHKYYTGRGPLESYAEGLEVNDGDLAFRVNFATQDKNGNIIDRRVGRNLTTQEATSLADEINSKVKLTSRKASFRFKNTIGHRGVLVIKSLEGKLSGNVTNTDPAYGKEGVFGVAKSKFENVVLKCQPLDDSKEAKDAAALANEFVEKSSLVLEEAEINKQRKKSGGLVGNVILMRDAGDRLPEFPKLSDLYGVNFASFVEMPVEKGIALLTGMDVVELPLPTKDTRKDFTLRAERVLESIEEYDGLYVHLKGPDEPAHDGKALDKKLSIEAIDKFFFGTLLPRIDSETTLICVTSDHSTPCILKAHSQDPVPLLIAGCAVQPDGCQTFSEQVCRRGSLGKLIGNKLMGLLCKSAFKK